MGGICCTTTMGGSGGTSGSSTAASASVPPVEAPMAIMLGVGQLTNCCVIAGVSRTGSALTSMPVCLAIMALTEAAACAANAAALATVAAAFSSSSTAGRFGSGGRVACQISRVTRVPAGISLAGGCPAASLFAAPTACC